MAGVTLTNIVKRYGSVTAVRDLTLDIVDKFMVLVGPSGCGKTTALRMIAGLEEITAGEIRIGDRVVNEVEPRDRDIAMVFQNYALYPHMSVFQNMSFGLELRKVPKAEIERRVNETARMLAIEPYLKRKPKELSGGQRQRVALGRAIVREPQVFLMDEPLSNLDAQLRVQTRAEIIKLHRRLGITTIYVTHDQVEAMTMGTRIAVMKDGILQQCDEPMRIYARPANMFVAGFIGTPSMNFLPAKLAQAGDDVLVDGGTFKLTLPRDRSPLVTQYIGSDIVFGVRPSDLFDSELPMPIDGNAGNTARANVELVEPMGDICTVYLSTGTSQIIATIDADTRAKDGHQLNIAFDMSKIHLFDPATELALF